MAFDINDPADLLALKNEVANDPLSIGYAAANGDTAVILDLLNNHENNPGGETGVPTLTAGELWKVVASDSATATQFEFNISNLFALAGGPDTDISEYRSYVIGLGDSQINNAINALTRPLSRAEVLFSDTLANGNTELVSITRDQWIAARES